jgi:hypothetical protein
MRPSGAVKSMSPRVSTLVESVVKVAPLVVNHQGQFPSVTISFNLLPGTAIGQAVSSIQQIEKDLGKPLSLQTSFQGNAQAFGASLSSTPILIVAALFVIYLILGVLYESLIYPITIISTLPSAGLGALLLLMAVPRLASATQPMRISTGRCSTACRVLHPASAAGQRMLTSSVAQPALLQTWEKTAVPADANGRSARHRLLRSPSPRLSVR